VNNENKITSSSFISKNGDVGDYFFLNQLPYHKNYGGTNLYGNTYGDLNCLANTTCNRSFGTPDGPIGNNNLCANGVRFDEATVHLLFMNNRYTYKITVWKQ